MLYLSSHMHIPNFSRKSTTGNASMHIKGLFIYLWFWLFIQPMICFIWNLNLNLCKHARAIFLHSSLPSRPANIRQPHAHMLINAMHSNMVMAWQLQWLLSVQFRFHLSLCNAFQHKRNFEYVYRQIWNVCIQISISDVFNWRRRERERINAFNVHINCIELVTCTYVLFEY